MMEAAFAVQIRSQPVRDRIFFMYEPTDRRDGTVHQSVSEK